MICTTSRCFFASASGSSLILSQLRLSMPPKRLDRQRPSSSTSLREDEDEHTSTSKKREPKVVDEDEVVCISTQLTEQKPKPCHTCGREITPRRKWAAVWPSIKYCSSNCKGGKKFPSVGQAAEMTDRPLDYGNGRPLSPTLLERCLFVDKLNLLLDREAWIEATLMQTVKTISDQGAVPKHTKSAAQVVPLSEVSVALHQDLDWHRQVNLADPRYSTKPTYITCIENNILRHVPGERERIRRAARRLVVFPLEQSYFAKRFGDTEEPHSIGLQDTRGKQLETCHDVSFAKGEMFLCRRQL